MGTNFRFSRRLRCAPDLDRMMGKKKKRIKESVDAIDRLSLPKLADKRTILDEESKVVAAAAAASDGGDVIKGLSSAWRMSDGGAREQRQTKAHISPSAPLPVIRRNIDVADLIRSPSSSR